MAAPAVEAAPLRPGRVYGPGQPHFSPLVNAGLRAIASIEPIARRLGEARPLSVDTVARATYRTALDPGESLLDVGDIRERAR